MISPQQLRGFQWRRVLGPLLCIAVLLGLGYPAEAGSSFKVGSFTKTTAGAPASQNVAHGLGETPKALILWTNGKTNESFSVDFHFGFGVTDGTTDKSVAMASEDGLSLPNTSRRIANKALTIVQWGETVLAEADLTAWDATNFTFNWTTNTGTASVIHFLAIGGSDISAKVVGWAMPTATGNQAVTGVGFKPDVVIHVHAGDDFESAPPASDKQAHIGLGVMDADGDEWATGLLHKDGGNPSDTQRGQQTDACIYAFKATLSVEKKASWVSMDADGFTVNFSTANNKAGQVVSLALKGLNVKPGSFAKSTGGAPASQAVTGVSFAPDVVLLSSFQETTQASPVAHAGYGLGGSDGTTEGSAAFQDTDILDPTSVDGIDKTSKVFVKVNNDTQTIDAEADLTSLDADGFTLNWTTNDAVATEMLYLALGSLDPTAVAMRSLKAVVYKDGVLLRWDTS